MEAKVYNQEGKEVSLVKLPEALFGLHWNADLVHQVVTALASNSRRPYAHTKGRGEVRGGGKKPWRQKGTGRARHGSIRSPIWRGGGVTHGPTKDQNYRRKINQKMKTRALFTVLSRKWRDGEVVFLDTLNLRAPKTKFAAAAIQKIAHGSGREKMSWSSGRRLLLALPQRDEAVARSFHNLKSVSLRPAGELNPAETLDHRYLIITDPEKSFTALAGRTKTKK